jgi:hypothetical protein
MYEIPGDVDWSFLIGKELLQVCYGKYQTQLWFEGNVNISIEGNIEHRDGATVLGRTLEREQTLMSLVALLGASIAGVSCEGQRVLVIALSNGHAVALFSDDSPYEAFSISAPGEQTLIV